MAETLGKLLLTAARRARDGSVYWQGPAEVRGRLVPVPLPATLFPGSLGVALFLAGLKRIAGGGSYGALCQESLVPLQREMVRLLAEPERARNVQQGIGGLSGLGSMIYGLVRIGELLGTREPYETAHAISSLITPERLSQDESLDVMLGSAGALLALLALDERRPEPNRNGHSALELAVLCGQHLLERRGLVREQGGFCHGTAGICHALLRLHARTGEQEFLKAALEGQAHERLLFDSKRQDWSYSLEPEPRFLNSWRKGSPGILLARCGNLDVLDTVEVRADISAALSNTHAAELNELDDVCCGNMGRVDALLYAQTRMGRPELLNNARELAIRVLERLERRGQLAFHPKFQGMFDPRFFPGVSGVGYTLLRLAAPGTLPCILALE